ncbi:MAG: hypothetical protein IPG59_12470 [Candidatus Melainabacteria bacterium]|nr:MAG: hypothetical protein IPG59_12470 [Candidatus Melainabacteria bacterium]
MSSSTKAAITASIVRRSGSGISGRIHFQSSISPQVITSTDARDAQANAGYHPLGYDFIGFSCQQVEGGYQATWSCAASCD